MCPLLYVEKQHLNHVNIINHAVAPWIIALQATLADRETRLEAFPHVAIHATLPQSCRKLNLPHSQTTVW